MAKKKLTPIQEAIAFWTERYKEAKAAGAMKTMEAADLFLQYLNALLSKEKDFAKDMWDSGNIKRESKKNIFAIQQPDFEKFYKQYEP